MKNPGTFIQLFPLKKMLSLAVLGLVISGCTINPINSENDAGIKGAPDWVNKGSTLGNRGGVRVFIGVSSARPQGDMALQKSIADDNSMAEVEVTLLSYLDMISNDFMASDRTDDYGVNDERSARKAKDTVARQIEDNATRHINDVVTQQVNDAIARQFKDTVSKKFKDDILRQIKKESFRNINEAVSLQIDFSMQMEEVISRQIRELVAHQVKNVSKSSMFGAKIIANWRDPGTNTIWSVSELEIKHVKSAMAGAGDFNLNLKKYFDMNSEIMFDRMLDEKGNSSPYLFK